MTSLRSASTRRDLRPLDGLAAVAGPTDRLVEQAGQVDGPEDPVHVVALGAHALVEAAVALDRLLGDEPEILERGPVDRIADAGLESAGHAFGAVAGAARGRRRRGRPPADPARTVGRGRPVECGVEAGVVMRVLHEHAPEGGAELGAAAQVDVAERLGGVQHFGQRDLGASRPQLAGQPLEPVEHAPRHESGGRAAGGDPPAGHRLASAPPMS